LKFESEIVQSSEATKKTGLMLNQD